MGSVPNQIAMTELLLFAGEDYLLGITMYSGSQYIVLYCKLLLGLFCAPSVDCHPP